MPPRPPRRPEPELDPGSEPPRSMFGHALIAAFFREVSKWRLVAAPHVDENTNEKTGGSVYWITRKAGDFGTKGE